MARESRKIKHAKITEFHQTKSSTALSGWATVLMATHTTKKTRDLKIQ